MNTYKKPRIYDRARVEWRASWNAFGRIEQGNVLDVSAGGCFVTSDSELSNLRPGVRVQLWLEVAARRRQIHVTGTVKWAGKSPSYACHGFGVQFDEVQVTIGAMLYKADAITRLEKLRQA